MSDKEYGIIVSANLRRIANTAGKTQSDICRDLHIGKSTVSSWFTGERVPRMDKIDLLCDYFRVKRSDLMEPHNETTQAEEDAMFLKAFHALDAKDKQILMHLLNIMGEKR